MMFSKKGDKRFEEKLVQNYQHGLLYILVDRQTGVNYLHVWNPQGSGLTPLLDADGKVIVDPVEGTDQ
ncbi:DUF6440 family protein [Paenibacillus urinalis]|uniref:DUF6440 family protein n=1 Tax=Paenibacillus urinalis TaxID=521520 RepID=A0AAX3N4U7_9BACL|nr:MULTISPECIES: DUF6440 family protein [Paenibacillus]WDH84850.1 DUF6440 family protein [Paenibacillus urinalis]WDH96310.1 DUF6440 family protein [Paenibacillus urinalis]WDI04533.1 DUF6440 family protein [Paenibacillus urinalis]